MSWEEEAGGGGRDCDGLRHLLALGGGMLGRGGPGDGRGALPDEAGRRIETAEVAGRAGSGRDRRGGVSARARTPNASPVWGVSLTAAGAADASPWRPAGHGAAAAPPPYQAAGGGGLGGR